MRATSTLALSHESLCAAKLDHSALVQKFVDVFHQPRMGLVQSVQNGLRYLINMTELSKTLPYSICECAHSVPRIHDRFDGTGRRQTVNLNSIEELQRMREMGRIVVVREVRTSLSGTLHCRVRRRRELGADPDNFHRCAKSLRFITSIHLLRGMRLHRRHSDRDKDSDHGTKELHPPRQLIVLLKPIEDSVHA